MILAFLEIDVRIHLMLPFVCPCRLYLLQEVVDMWSASAIKFFFQVIFYILQLHVVVNGGIDLTSRMISGGSVCSEPARLAFDWDLLIFLRVLPYLISNTYLSWFYLHCCNSCFSVMDTSSLVTEALMFWIVASYCSLTWFQVIVAGNLWGSSPGPLFTKYGVGHFLLRMVCICGCPNLYLLASSYTALDKHLMWLVLNLCFWFENSLQVTWLPL